MLNNMDNQKQLTSSLSPKGFDILQNYSTELR